MKILIISIILLYLVYRITKYYFKIQQLNFQKQKEFQQSQKKHSNTKTTNWEAETIDFEEIQNTKK